MSKLSLGANAAHSGPASVLAFKSMRNTHRVTKQVRHPVLSAGMLAVMMAGSAAVTLGQESEGQAGPLVLKQGYFYVAGAYDNPAAPTSMSGQMYVEYQIPAELRAGAYPIIMVHGGGHTGAGFQSTPDGRPGWADYFIGHGWPVYVVDQPGRAKSPYVDAVYGALGSSPAVTQAENVWSASEKASPAVQWPQATLHTQWPGDGSHTHGDTVFDQYYAHLAPGISNGALQEKLTANALVALLEKLGPSIVLIHSQPGTALWVMADTRPDLVKALVAVEPSGPPIYGEIVPNPPLAGPPVARPWGPSINRLTYDPATTDPSQLSIVHQAQPDGPGLTACWLQAEPARQLPRLAGLPILHVLSQSSYHAPYDHCTTKWLNQAGVPTDFVKLTGLGIFGNGHLMAVEKNHLEIAGVIERWLVQTLGHAPGEPRKLPETERSLGNVEIAEQGVFFVGGAYNDPVNPTFMSGQMYVRYQIPKERNKGAYPVVLVHGGGQLGTSFTGTPDDRSGWADYLLSHGFPVYVVDQPGRGKSPYITAVYGPRGVPNLQSIEDLFTAPERANQWPQAHLHTQWPGTGLPGDYAFDQFFASQWSGMNATMQEQTTSRALVALLEKIGPAFLITHSQSGPHGWEAADARPDLVKGIIAVEPNGPPFYEVNFLGAPNWFSNGALGRPYGITRFPLTFSPAVTDPSQLTAVQQPVADGPNLVRCFLQAEPAHTLPRLSGVPIVILTSEASFRATYDHCTSKFLTQAGVPNTRLRLESVGIHGNGHMMMLEKNNLEIAGVISKLLEHGLRLPGKDGGGD